jgi:hypothetical protein
MNSPLAIFKIIAGRERGAHKKKAAGKDRRQVRQGGMKTGSSERSRKKSRESRFSDCQNNAKM